MTPQDYTQAAQIAVEIASREYPRSWPWYRMVLSKAAHYAVMQDLTPEMLLNVPGQEVFALFVSIEGERTWRGLPRSASWQQLLLAADKRIKELWETPAHEMASAVRAE